MWLGRRKIERHHTIFKGMSVMSCVVCAGLGGVV